MGVGPTISPVQASCGFAVPFMDLRADRHALRDWAIDKGDAGLHSYWDDRNRISLDGLPTVIEANL